MKRSVHLLVASAGPQTAHAVRAALADATSTMSFRVSTAASTEELWKSLEDSEAPDVAILDENFAPDRCAPLLPEIRKRRISTPFILVGDGASDDTASDGTIDRLPLEGLSPNMLVSSIRYAIDLRHSRSAERQIEDALRRSQDELREVVRQAGIFRCTHDLEGKILSIEGPTAAALGYPPEELVGRSIPDLLVPAHRAEFADYMRKIREEGSATGFMALLTRSGERCYWNYQNRLVVEPVPVVHATAVDVTDRIRAQADAALSAQRQSAILDALPANVALLSADGTILAINDAWRRFARENGGDPAGCGEGVNYLEACEHDAGSGGGAEVAAAIRDVLAGRCEIFSREYECDAPEKRRWYRLVVAPVRSTGIRGAVVMHVDRTEEHEAEVLRRRQAMIFENMHDAVVIVDPDGMIRDWNPSAAGMYGLERGRSVGQPISTIARTPDGRAGVEAIRLAVKAEGRWSGEVSYDRPDGTRGMRELLVLPLGGARGGVVGYAGISRDITARKDAERVLHDSERRYRDLFERNLAGIYRSTRDGRILEFNAAFARILGYEPDALGTVNARDLYFTDADRDAVLEHLDRSPVLEGYECCLKRRDGRPVWVIENAALVDGPDGAGLEGSILDITDRRAVEEALRESEERYRFLFEGNPLPMWVYAIDTLRFLEVNDAAVRHYGYTREEFLEMGLDDIWPVEDREIRHGEISPTARRPQPFSPSRHRRKDGAIIHVEVSSVDLPGGDRRRMALARDVTERIAAEQALQQSEEKYRKIVDLAPVGIYRTTIDGTLLSCNDSFARIFGWPSADAILAHGTTRDLFDRPEDRRQIIDQNRAAGRIDALEIRLKRRDGSRVWVQITAQLRSGEVAPDDDYIEGFVVDVSERKGVEEQRARLQSAVLETAREWRDTFDAIDTPVLVLDAKGAVRRLNRAAMLLSGKGYADILEKTVGEIGPGEPWASAAELVARRAPTPAAGHLCRDEATGRTWELAATAFENDSAGIRLFILVARDITPLVELQRSVMKSQSMAAMGSLVAGVAHEVRNPLFAISATLDAFDLRFRDHQDYRKYAAALRAQIDRMTNLMHDLLDFAKPAVFDRAPVEIGAVVEEAMRGCADAAAARRVTLEFAPPDGLPPVDVDRARTVQVFVNLVENAVQHSAPGKTVRVTAARDGNAIDLAVEDQGPGFRAEDFARLFEPFFTRRQGGTGLGLAIVRRIVTEQGGTVVPENREGGGARVRVSLPIAKEAS